jgi:hypothetical protein
VWPFSPRKRKPSGYAVVDEKEARMDRYPCVYVNLDGSARELHEGERRYLETRFSPFDGARPYVKGSYSQKDGWGEIKGFLKRSHLSHETAVGPAPPESPSKPLSKEEHIQFLRDKGLEVFENTDRSELTGQSNPRHFGCGDSSRKQALGARGGTGSFPQGNARDQKNA